MKYRAPSKCFFRLPNEIFNMQLDPYAFMIYSYLQCCAGNRGECWPSLETMHQKLGISISTIQDRINYLKKRKFIDVRKRVSISGHSKNVYVMLSLDNPEIYRDLIEPEELPMS